LFNGRRWQGVDRRLLALMASCWCLGVVALVVQAVGLLAGEPAIHRPAQVIFPIFFVAVVVTSFLAARQHARRDR
jgi:uncharacterized membrane protein